MILLPEEVILSSASQRWFGTNDVSPIRDWAGLGLVAVFVSQSTPGSCLSFQAFDQEPGRSISSTVKDSKRVKSAPGGFEFRPLASYPTQLTK